MIEVHPFDDQSAMTVLSRLDPHDFMEAEATRGQRVTHLGLFADWRAIEGVRLASWVILDSGRPFALVALAHTGQAGVAQAAMLARDHRQFRRPLVALLHKVQLGLPVFARESGVRRIEARAWARHPRASLFLERTGFRHEADMPGFGRDGREIFRQFAWIDPACLPSLDPQP